MGSSLSCLCPHSSAGRIVIVMKENGKLMRFKEGIRVKDLLAAHPYHKVIRHGSDHQVILPDSFELDCDGFYSLLPQGQALSNTTYICATLMSYAESKDFISSRATAKTTHNPSHAGNNIDGQEILGQVFLLDACGYKKSPWRPALQTIPEIM